MKFWKTAETWVKALTVTFTVLFGVTNVGGAILKENQAAVNRALNIQTSRVEQAEGAEDEDTEYYKSKYSSVKEVKSNGEKIIQETMEEGATLLKNENNALPLSNNAKISLYSVSSIDPIITGTGSSGSSNILENDAFESVDLKTAFESVEGMNIQVNPTLWDFYRNNKSTYARKRSDPWGAFFSIGDAPWSDIPSAAKEGYNDAAIFVVSRRSGEGKDMGSFYADDMINSMWGGLTDDTTNGNYLALSPNELSVLRGLKEQKDAGQLNSIIVLMNSANPLQCDFMEDESLGVDAMLWCGNLGDTGSVGVANIMAGKVAPSGRLSDTFWKYHYLNPVAANFAMDQYHKKGGKKYYDWMEEVAVTWLQQQSINSSDAAMRENMKKESRSTVYAEGIYVGYRYTETRYEDYILGRANAGEFDYYEAVSYPFGYGLSYTDFEYSDFTVTRKQQTGSMEDHVYEISVKVTNTGTEYSGKEVVQIYLQKPYTNYDENWEIEKSAVDLVAFGKTGVLAPGASEVVTLTVNEKELACYDTFNYGTYVLEDGDYYFTVGKDAHDALNNIIDSKKAGGEELVNTPVAKGNSGLGNRALAYKQTVGAFDATTYAISTKAMENNIKDTPTRITNQFETADILYYDGATTGFEYITRSNWDGTVKLGFDENGNCLNNQVKVTVTEEMYQARKEAMSDPEPDDGEYPVMGDDSQTHLNLIDLRAHEDDDDDPTNNPWIAYNDSAWDMLLDQLTWDEICALLNNGMRLTGAIESIAKPETFDFNGSVGPVTRYDSNSSINRGLAMKTDDPDKNELICFYPSNGICASTFNKELMKRYGEQWGEESLWSGVNGLYGMGINMHRSPYGGRNFEYYSEDPILSGQISAETVKGAAEKGMYCYLKHCVLNDQETYRIGGYCWIREQPMRELYLKPFQIAIEDGGANSVMTAEPALGLEWSGQQGFCQTVLRDEFGMTGIAVSDFTRDVDGNYLKALLAGSDIPDGTISDLFDNVSPTEGYGELATAMREAVKHILYTVVHSNAMNGFSSNTRVIKITPWWMTAVDISSQIVSIAYTVVLGALALVVIGDFGIQLANGSKKNRY